MYIIQTQQALVFNTNRLSVKHVTSQSHHQWCVLRLDKAQDRVTKTLYNISQAEQYSPWLVNWLWHAKLVQCTFKSHFRLHVMSHCWPYMASRLNFDTQFHINTVPSCLAFYFVSCMTWFFATMHPDRKIGVLMLLTWPVVLKPNSSGQETVKARTHTVAIITKTLFLERWVVLYKTGITTAVYLQTHTH